MADDDRLNPDADCFKPPAIPTEVHCIHCGHEYESYLIEWRTMRDERGREMGFWCCPVEGCDGAGFGFDILPTDPEYIGEDGQPMFCFDDDEWDEEELDEFEADLDEDADALIDPSPPPFPPSPDFPTGEAADPPDKRRNRTDPPPFPDIDDDDIPW